MTQKNTSALRAANQILIEQLRQHKERIAAVIEEQGKALFSDANILSDDDVREYSSEFFDLLITLLESGEQMGRRGPEFHAMEQFFANFARQIQARGGRLDSFVRYVQALQRVLIEELEESPEYSFEQSREVLLLLARIFNHLVLDVFYTYLKEKEQTIQAQQEELRQVSTPITEIWDGVLTLPVIGSLDSSRTMMVMENLLNRIEKDRARVVVMDVTGVLAIDSQVSHYLIQMVRAIGLMGAEAILTGIRPEIARALTNLNIDLGGVTTRGTLSDGLKEAFRRMGIEVHAAGG